MNFPNKKYSVIYADPPWSYDDGGATRGGVDKHYSTMDIETIKALPVNEIADSPSVLLLWATFPLLPEALDVIKAWGFTYKTLGFAWEKTNENGSPVFGVGHYTRSNPEVCLLAIKGNALSMVKSKSISSVIHAPLKEHSRKPGEVRARIVELFGNVSRIELFARHRFEGWDCWGDEVPKDTQTLLRVTA